MLSNKSVRYSLRQLARHFNCSPNTIRNELKRGAHHNTGRYGAKRAQNAYEQSHANSIKKSRRFLSGKFVSWVVDMVLEKSWSLDTCHGFAKENRLFLASEMVCVKTLYNYVDSMLLAVRNIDLPLKVRRRKRRHNIKEKLHIFKTITSDNGSEFIRNNSKVRFVKEAQYRVDKPDYAERAVTEALVNALIHRDYIVLGSEVHIDMFDDRVEITSPGGMFGGGSIHEYDIYSIRSMRRNPVIADLFHRMKYMERRGSGLRKIVSETEKLPGYTESYKPVFFSTATDFRVILKNVNYNLEGDTQQVIHQVTNQDAELSTVSKQILAFCTTPKSKKELAALCGFKDLRNFTVKHINPLLESGQLEMTIPDKPKSRNQKYITVHSK